MRRGESDRHRACKDHFSRNPDLLLPNLVDHFSGRIEIREAHKEYRLGNKQGYVDIMLVIGTHYNGTYYVPVEVKTSEKRSKTALKDAGDQLRRYFGLAARGKIDFPSPEAIPLGLALVSTPDQYEIEVVHFDRLGKSNGERPNYPQPYSLESNFPNSTEDEVARLHNAIKRRGDPTKPLMQMLASELWYD